MKNNLDEFVNLYILKCNQENFLLRYLNLEKYLNFLELINLWKY